MSDPLRSISPWACLWGIIQMKLLDMGSLSLWAAPLHGLHACGLDREKKQKGSWAFTIPSFLMNITQNMRANNECLLYHLNICHFRAMWWFINVFYVCFSNDSDEAKHGFMGLFCHMSIFDKLLECFYSFFKILFFFWVLEAKIRVLCFPGNWFTNEWHSQALSDFCQLLLWSWAKRIDPESLRFHLGATTLAALWFWVLK